MFLFPKKNSIKKLFPFLCKKLKQKKGTGRIVPNSPADFQTRVDPPIQRAPLVETLVVLASTVSGDGLPSDHYASTSMPPPLLDPTSTFADELGHPPPSPRSPPPRSSDMLHDCRLTIYHLNSSTDFF